MDKLEAGVDLAVAEAAVGFGQNLIDLRVEASRSAGIVQRLRGVDHHEVQGRGGRTDLGLSCLQDEAGQGEEWESGSHRSVTVGDLLLGTAPGLSFAFIGSATAPSCCRRASHVQGTGLYWVLKQTFEKVTGIDPLPAVLSPGFGLWRADAGRCWEGPGCAGVRRGSSCCTRR